MKLLNNLLLVAGCWFSVAIPSLVFAADAPKNYKQLINIFLGVLGSLGPILIGLTLLLFFWGLSKFIFAGGSEKNSEYGKNLMVWGLIGLFFMFSIFGIIALFGGTIFPSLRSGSGAKVNTNPGQVIQQTWYSPDYIKTTEQSQEYWTYQKSPPTEQGQEPRFYPPSAPTTLPSQ